MAAGAGVRTTPMSGVDSRGTLTEHMRKCHWHALNVARRNDLHRHNHFVHLELAWRLPGQIVVPRFNECAQVPLTSAQTMTRIIGAVRHAQRQRHAWHTCPSCATSPTAGAGPDRQHGEN